MDNIKIILFINTKLFDNLNNGIRSYLVNKYLNINGFIFKPKLCLEIINASLKIV